MRSSRSAEPRPGRVRFLRLLDSLAATDPGAVGAKAAALARARLAGLPALPGYVLPVAAGRVAMRAGRAALRRGDKAAARRAVLATEIEPACVSELAAAIESLGGRVIVRSSSPLEADQRWSGAFASVGEIGAADAAPAVRSCLASAFAADPLVRLARSGEDVERLELAVLIQPELAPDAGGVARVTDDAVRITGIDGHPGRLLAGWTDGATTDTTRGSSELHSLIGPAAVRRVGELARAVHRVLGHDGIEWAVSGGEIHLLQSSRGPAAAPPPRSPTGIPDGRRIAGTSCVPGDAVGRLTYVRPHEPAPGPPAAGEDRILICDHPLPALAPLLFGARGVVARTGPVDSHLGGVARSLGVPMLVRTPVERITGPLERMGPGPLGAIDGARQELVIAPWEASA